MPMPLMHCIGGFCAFGETILVNYCNDIVVTMTFTSVLL